jgi:L-ascorbate metabolism protein UlaG (beta-lactamase superfamily)
VQVTHVGGPTVLLETAGWRILTDPTFDPPGRRYGFGWGTSSRKTVGPAVPVEDLGPIDLVLLSHDHHADNLDDAGRALLPSVTDVLTTVSGAGRLRLDHGRGLEPGQWTLVHKDGSPDLRVTATPCRHGPPLSRPIAGEVVGFVVEVLTPTPTTVWMTGDTVLTPAVRAVAGSYDVDVLLLHLGGVRFPITGPLRYSMVGREALRLVDELDPGVVVPVHYEGWSHFAEPVSELAVTFAGAPTGIRERIRWLRHGVPEQIDTGP